MQDEEAVSRRPFCLGWRTVSAETEFGRARTLQPNATRRLGRDRAGPSACKRQVARFLRRHARCFKVTMGNLLTLTPQLVITREEMDRALDITDESLTEVES